MPVLDTGLGVSLCDSGCVGCSPGPHNEVVQFQDWLAQSCEATGRNGGVNELRHGVIMGCLPQASHPSV